MDLTSLVLALAIPAAVAFAAAWLLPRLWRTDDHRVVSVLWLIVALAAAVALPLGGGYGVLGSAAPLVLPGGLAPLLVPLAALPLLARWKGVDASTPGVLLSAAIGAVAVGLLSFPWWDRGLGGWVALGASAVAAGLLTLGLERAARGGHRAVTIAWGATAAAAAPFFVFLTNTAHAEALAVVMAPIAGAALAGFLGGAGLFTPRGAVLPAIVIAALVANAAMRYVPGSDDPDSVVWTLRLAPLALLLGPWVCAGVRRLLPGTKGVIVGVALWIVVVAGGAVAAYWAYNYQGEADGSGSDAEVDFYQNYGS